MVIIRLVALIFLLLIVAGCSGKAVEYTNKKGNYSTKHEIQEDTKCVVSFNFKRL